MLRRDNRRGPTEQARRIRAALAQLQGQKDRCRGVYVPVRAAAPRAIATVRLTRLGLPQGGAQDPAVDMAAKYLEGRLRRRLTELG